MSRRSSSRPRKKPASARRPAAGPTPAQLAAQAVDAVADAMATDDPLEAEAAASWIASAELDTEWRAIAACETEAELDAVPHPVLAPVRRLAELRDAELRHPALALVHALAALAPGDEDVAGAAEAASKRLRFLGARSPVWAEALAAPETASCWCVRDVFSEAMTLYVGVRHPGFATHSIGARIEQDRHAELVDIVLGDAPERLVPQVEASLADDPDAALLLVEEWTPARAGAMLAEVVAGVEETMGEELEDDGFDLFTLLRSRAELLTDAVEAASDEELDLASHRSPLDELDYARLLARFRASNEYAATDNTNDVVARSIVQWVFDWVAGGVGRVGPSLVVDLLGSLEEAAAADPDRTAHALLLQHGVPTARAWARFCAAATGLPDAGLARIEETLDELSERAAHAASSTDR
ncbi:MAG: hypothetical protein JWM98_1941 [Thermoleophilia bacterium]|nr:hypothetical protein [Thermoleophilia bacterium]